MFIALIPAKVFSDEKQLIEKFGSFFFAKIAYSDLKDLETVGYTIGMVKYCPTVSSTDYGTFIENIHNWLKVTATVFENPKDYEGFLNKRYYFKLKSIVDNSISVGEGDGYILRRSWDYKNKKCPNALSTPSIFSGPRASDLRRIIER